MKNFYILLLAFFTIGVNSQTVSTYLDSPDAVVDDALALDSQGNLYGSSFYGGEVTRISPNGTVTPFVTGLVYANGLAVDSNDNVYVAAYAEGSINKYDSDGNLLQIFPIGDGYPSGLIKAHRSDNMIFTDVGDSSIKKLNTANGSITTLYQGAPLNTPVGLAFNPRGDLYIGNYLGREIYRLTARRGQLEYVATVPSSDNDAPFLAFIAYSQGFLYGTIYGEHKIYKINPRSVDDVEIYAGSTFGHVDGHLSEATFAYPSGLVFNRSGNKLYVSEFDGMGNIRKIKKGRGHGHGHDHSNNCKMGDGLLSINTYPNPASDFIYIVNQSENKVYNNFNIKLYSLTTSHLVLDQKGVEIKDSYALSLLGLKTGMYELVISNEEATTSKTIIIKGK